MKTLKKKSDVDSLQKMDATNQPGNQGEHSIYSIFVDFYQCLCSKDIHNDTETQRATFNAKHSILIYFFAVRIECCLWEVCFFASLL